MIKKSNWGITWESIWNSVYRDVQNSIFPICCDNVIKSVDIFMSHHVNVAVNNDIFTPINSYIHQSIKELNNE